AALDRVDHLPPPDHRPMWTSFKDLVRALGRPAVLLRIAIAAAASVEIAAGTFGLPRDVDLLAPSRLHVIALVPFFFLVRITSLTDLSLAQQVLQASLRSLVIAAVAVALARPSW